MLFLLYLSHTHTPAFLGVGVNKKLLFFFFNGINPFMFVVRSGIFHLWSSYFLCFVIYVFLSLPF